MKKVLLVFLALGIGSISFAQRTYTFKKEVPEFQRIQKMMVGIEPVKAASIVSSKPSDVPAFMPQTKNTTFVNIVDLGTSANAYSYGYGGGQKEILASVPEVGNGIVTNFHRMGGALDPGGNTGDLGYDVSFDGGLSWTKMVEIYQAVNNAGGTYFTDAARYPSHGLYNPVGNTSADDVWLQYHAPNLDGSNATESWGGYSYGVANLSDPQNTKTKNLQSSTPADGIYQYIIDAYDITRQGKVFAVDVNQDWSSGSVVYKGSLIVNKGEWDEAINDFVFTQELLAADVDPAVTRPSHVKTAFSEDGMTGYISMLADNGSCELINAQRSLYPIIFKTTDGGENWGDPVGIQLGGPNGLHGIVYDLLSDEQIAELFNEPLPARTEIPYTTAFDHDVVVDAAGNLHIAIVIGVTGSNDYSIVSGEYFFAAYDIFTTDGGTTWHAVKLGNIRKFRGTFATDYTEDNRIQVSISPDRQSVFVLWLDSDIEDAPDNTRPNIFARGVRTNNWGTADLTSVGGLDQPTNVTLLSTGMWNAPFHAVAPKSFFADGKYTIPISFQPIVDEDPGNPVQFKYITNFYFTDADFSVVRTNEIQALKSFDVGQNFPNPVMDKITQFEVTLGKTARVSTEIYSLTGQKVMTKDSGIIPANTPITISLNVELLPAGVYFYTVQAGSEKVTRKMIVK